MQGQLCENANAGRPRMNRRFTLNPLIFAKVRILF